MIDGPLPIALTAAALLLLLQLLRTRRMREKYAFAWAVLGLAIIVLAVFPGLLDAVAGWVGVAEPPNLLFFGALAVLYAVCLQASVELSSLAEDRRVLVEEVAMLRLEVEQLAHRVPDGAVPGDDSDRGPAA